MLWESLVNKTSLLARSMYLLTSPLARSMYFLTSPLAMSIYLRTHRLARVIDFIFVSLDCGKVYSGLSGYLKSPGHPNRYNFAENCLYQIRGPENHQIRLKFLRFNVEDSVNCRNDALEIFDVARNGQRRPIKKYCGYTTPADYTHTNNRLDLVFTSNFLDQYSGFYIEYHAFERAATTTPTTTTIPPVMSGKYV